MLDQSRKWFYGAYASGWFLAAFSNIVHYMCCSWLEEMRLDNSIWWWEAFVIPTAPVFLCFLRLYSPVFVTTIQIKDLTKAHGRRQKRNHSSPPCGVAHGFSSWMELRNICSLVLKQASHKSSGTVTTMQQLLPQSLRVLLISYSFVSSTSLALPPPFM